MATNQFEYPAFTLETSSAVAQFPEIRVDGLPAYESLYDDRKVGAQEAGSSLNLAISLGLIDPKRPLDMLDWGTAEGCSTLALIELARLNGGRVTGVDHPRAAAALIEKGILSPERMVAGDGVEFLDQSTARGRQFDLITACMFGADQTGRLARRFLPAALANLSEAGRLIVYSDYHTMTAFENICQDTGVNYRPYQAQFHSHRPARRIISVSQYLKNRP